MCRAPAAEDRVEFALDLSDRELDGYLGENLPNPLILLPPPPDEGSAEGELELKLVEEFLITDRNWKEQAKRDAILAFPFAADAFNPVLNGIIHADTTPGKGECL